jgi:hypothetical protein
MSAGWFINHARPFFKNPYRRVISISSVVLACIRFSKIGRWERHGFLEIAASRDGQSDAFNPIQAK